MKTINAVLSRLRKICLSLPDAQETLTWGKPHFRVADKIFAGCDEEDGRVVVGFKLEKAHAAAIVADPRFWPAPYVGHKGWVSMDVSRVKDWAEVASLIVESYRLIAPKRMLAKLEQPTEVKAEARPARAKARAARRPVSKGARRRR